MFGFSNLFHNITQHLREATSGNFVVSCRVRVVLHCNAISKDKRDKSC